MATPPDVLHAFTLAGTAALDDIDELAQRGRLDPEDADVRQLSNNYLVHALHERLYARGAAFAEKIQDLGPRNPNIFHNTACLYCFTNELDRAADQVRLARRYGGE